MKSLLFSRALPVGLIFIFLLSCTETESPYNVQELSKSWNCTELYQNDEVQQFIPGTIRFVFNTDSTYSYQGGIHKEQGKWWLEGTLLVTQAEGDMVKKVEIESLNDTTLQLLMNDRGAQTRMKLLAEDTGE